MTRDRSRRYGFVGIIVPHNAGQGPAIQAILSDHAHLVQGRMGLPHLEDDTLAVITLIVHGTTDELGSLTGRLGRLPGVIVKSGLAPETAP
jgi:aspartate ammonia-lyase